MELDFTDEESINDAAKGFADKPLSVLTNCGGMYQLWDDKRFTEQTAGDLLAHFKVNVVGPFLAAKAFLLALERAGRGKIITVSSDYASTADNTGGNACYRISKTGVNQLTKTMAAGLAKLGSKVMTGFYGEDNMEECMNGLADIVARFGTAECAEIPMESI
ncbi:hypothetical protein B0H63DRAFT_510199 [Podospora didyma]|uniref:Uncharacterized protein n=1 Tax=Podospora didyma TaxID=330526 RepID=A0AAE0NPM3_9PEZI|nr:hypothetical protein B0H63DRAFT_510199 [Podospora didyma]